MGRAYFFRIATALLAVTAFGAIIGVFGTFALSEQRSEQPAARSARAKLPLEAHPVLAPVLAGGIPQAANTPRGLARQITVAARVIRDPDSSPQLVEAAGWTAQVAYRTLGRHPEWDEAVRTAVPPALREVVRHHVAARREFQDMQGAELPDTLPAWRIIEPLPPERLRALYRQAQRRFGVAWEVLAAVNLVETGMGRIVGLSSAGARGPMQFMPATWQAYGMGGNVWKPHDAIMGAANYLAATGAASGTDAGLRNALYAYNHDVRYVRAVLHYTQLMRDDPRAFLGLHAWRIYYRTSVGDILLPVGYESQHEIPVQRYRAQHPERVTP